MCFSHTIDEIKVRKLLCPLLLMFHQYTGALHAPILEITLHNEQKSSLYRHILSGDIAVFATITDKSSWKLLIGEVYMPLWQCTEGLCRLHSLPCTWS